MRAVHRWVGAGAVAVLGLGMGLQPAGVPSAQAAVSGAELTASATASANDPGCVPTLSGIAPPGVVDVPADGRKHTVRLDRESDAALARFDATAVVTARVSGNSWGTTRVRMWMTAAASAAPKTASSVCSPTVRSRAAVHSMGVTVPRRSWLVVRGKGTARGTTDAAVGVERADSLSGIAVKPGKSLTRLIAPGSYNVGGNLVATVTVPFRSLTVRSSRASADTSVSIYPIGTLRTNKGKAKRLVRVNHRNCARNRVRAKLSPRLRVKAKRATFYVHGKKRAVLTGRDLRRKSVVLRKLGSRSNGRVEAVVIKKSGARVKLRATSWPCR